MCLYMYTALEQLTVYFIYIQNLHVHNVYSMHPIIKGCRTRHHAKFDKGQRVLRPPYIALCQVAESSHVTGQCDRAKSHTRIV